MLFSCFRSSAMLVLAVLLGAACNEDFTAASDHHGHDAGAPNTAHAPGRVATDGGLDEREVPCTDDFPRFKAGIAVQAGALTVQLVSVMPEPPRQKVPNHWVVDIKDQGGLPVPGATLANPVSFMQVHNHYGRDPVASNSSEPGRYEIKNIDFNMRGPWEVIFDVERSGARAETARLKICVE